jgi:hypothetical protein
MMSQPKSARTRAEERFDKARRTHEVASSLIEQELRAVRSKTAKLKAARLAKEAEDAASEASVKKPAAKTRKTARRAPAAE